MHSGTTPTSDTSPPANTTNTNNSSSSSTQQESIAFWQDFNRHACNVRSRKEVIYEDKDAKEAAKRQRQERIFVRSIESDSAVFDISTHGHRTADFFGPLVQQHPKALGWVPRKLSPSCVIVSFEGAASRDTACAGVTVGGNTIIGTPTLHMESSIYLVNLQGLPLMKRDDLAIAIRQNISRYGQVLDVKVCTDHFNLLTGKGSVLLDTSPKERTDPIMDLEHEVHMETNGHRRIVLARWRGMAVHCNYCKKEGHKIADCAKLAARKEHQQQRKLCYICQSPDHLKANCPRSPQPRAGEKRARTEDALVDPRTVPDEESMSAATATHETDVLMADNPSSTSPSRPSQCPYGLRPSDKTVNVNDSSMSDELFDDSGDDTIMEPGESQDASPSGDDQDQTDGGGRSSSTPSHQL